MRRRLIARVSQAVASSGRLCVGALMLAGPLRPQTSDSTIAPADSAAIDTAPRTVSGRIVRPAARAMQPVGGVWVILHRVGSDTAGPIDSMRASSSGRYAFRYRPRGSAGAVYFVSTSFDGIAYFTAPLTHPHETGDAAEITVYDTTSAPVPINVRGRHLVVSAPRVDGTREVVEVFDLTNDSSVTRISPDDAHPTWTTILPSRATDFAVGQSDISPSSIRESAGRVTTVAPFAPGLKQLSFAYRLPAASFPLAVPIEHDIGVLEVLVEEPGAAASAPQLKKVQPVAVEGRAFTRYLGQNVPANAVLRITVPVAVTSWWSERSLPWLAGALGALMAIAAALAAARHRRGTPAPVEATPDISPERSAETLAREIAALDEAFEREPVPSASAREAYRGRREALKAELVRALDATRQRT